MKLAEKGPAPDKVEHRKLRGSSVGVTVSHYAGTAVLVVDGSGSPVPVWASLVETLLEPVSVEPPPRLREKVLAVVSRACNHSLKSEGQCWTCSRWTDEIMDEVRAVLAVVAVDRSGA